MSQIERIRNSTEAQLVKNLDKLGRRTRRKVRDAMLRYGSAARIPPTFWMSIVSDAETETQAVMLTALVAFYSTEVNKLSRTTQMTDTESKEEQTRKVRELNADEEKLRQRATPTSQNIARDIGQEYVTSARRQLINNIDKNIDKINALDPAQAKKAIDKAVVRALDKNTAASVVSHNTTEAATASQRSAMDDVGKKLNKQMDMRWITERDGRVCPVCKPLDGQWSKRWSRILSFQQTRGIVTNDQAMKALQGPPAHPHCRCVLETVIAYEPATAPPPVAEVRPVLA